MRLNNETACKKWLGKASEDVRLAKFGLTAKPPFIEAATFHSQQAAEKALKAFLIFHNEPVPRTHDLRMLSGKVLKIDSELEEVLKLTPKLTPYVIAARYPDAANEDLSLDQAEESIKIAETVLRFISQKLKF